jgi:hypothetical protein
MYDEFKFEISNNLKEKGISRLAKEDNTIVIDYNKNSIRFDIDQNWQKTIKNFDESSKGIIKDLNLVQHLKSFFSTKYKEIISNTDNNTLTVKENNGKEIVKIFKYSNSGKIPLHEAIILDGKPVFIKYDKDDQRIETVDYVVETTRIIRAPPREEYPYTPYEFESIEELNHFIDKAKTITLDEIYIKCKTFFSKYVDQDDHIITILDADCILTYFQDLFPAIHYSEGIGDNDVGKSSIGYTFEYTAYRVVKGTSISGANYYRVLGTDEPGQCVIIEDEGDSISEDPDKVKILKSGYEYSGQVPKINMNSSNQEQKWFKTYCYKMILAEKSLSHYKAKGLVDRTFSFHCRPGKVKNSIKEVVSENISKSPILQNQFKEIMNFRKLLLLYRLLHYRDPLPQIETGLKNRDNELCKPLLQLFYGTQALEEIIHALNEFVIQRKERKANSLEAALYPIIKKIINSLKKDSLYNYQKTIPVSFSDIWNEITDEYEGMEGTIVNSNQYETLDYGILYKNALSKFISDKFGATIHRKSKGSVLTFDLEKLGRFEEIYGNNENSTKSKEVSIDVKLVSEEEEEETVNDLSDIDNNQLQKVDEEESNENSNKNKVDICVSSVGYVSNVGILECVSQNITKKENNILTNIDSMKDNSQNNNLPIFNNNYNKINLLSANDKKDDTHPLEPTLPTLPTLSIEESSALPCPYCDYKGIEVDLDLHIYEKHRYYLRQLKRDSPDFNVRTDYIVEQIKLQQQRIMN